MTITSKGPLASCVYNTSVGSGPAVLTHPCTGDGQATVTFGAQTRTRYRFPGPGARLAVDPRDAHGIEGVPNVRRVYRGAAGTGGG